MRGSINYDALMHHITRDDVAIFQKIIQDNIEATEKTRMPLV